jgi:hypothetical protein
MEPDYPTGGDLYNLPSIGLKDSQVSILEFNTLYKDTNNWLSQCNELF